MSPLLLRIVAARSESTRGVGTDRTAAGPVPLPRQCPAARRPPVTPPRPGSGTVRRAALASRRFVMPSPWFLVFRSCSETDESDVRRVPAPRIPRPGKGQGYAPLRRRGCVATEKQVLRSARYRINPEPRLAARPGPRPATRLGVDDRTGTWRPLHGCGSRHTPRRGPTAQARRTSSPGSSVVNCAIGIPSTERPEWPTSHRECQE